MRILFQQPHNISTYSQSNSFFFSFLFYSFLFQKIIIFLKILYFIENFNISENNIILLSNRPGPGIKRIWASGIIIIPQPAACTCKTMQWSEYLWLLLVKWWRRGRWCSDIQSGGGLRCTMRTIIYLFIFAKKIVGG